MDKRGFLILILIIIAGLAMAVLVINGLFSKGAKETTQGINGSLNKEAKNISITECRADSDCVADACCHAKNCVASINAPICKGILCTQECEPGTLDCGQGSCKCVSNKCEVALK